MEINIGDRIIKFNSHEDYVLLDANVMQNIIFDMYYNLIEDYNNMTLIYTKEEIQNFYFFLHTYCFSINKFKRAYTKPSLLLCLSYMIQNDKMLKKTFAEYFFIKTIQTHFQNWFYYRRLKRKSMWTRLFAYCKNILIGHRNKDFIKLTDEIKLYCRTKQKYPYILRKYDHESMFIKMQRVKF